MAKFRKKPIIVEAFQMTKKAWKAKSTWPDWLTNAYYKPLEEDGSLSWPSSPHANPIIITLKGAHRVSWGDWIIQEVKGELYPCKPDIFETTYVIEDDTQRNSSMGDRF